MTGRARNVLLRTTFVVGVTGGLVFALLEASARVYLFGAAGLVPSRVNSVHGLHQTGFLRASPEPRLGWELVPDLRARFKLVPFETNSRGLRDIEYALEKPDGTFRVAVVGASFALPAGVAIEDAFHSRLEEQLTRQSRGLRYEFLNFAVGMYSPEQVLAALELRALDYAPDLVLFTTTRLSEPAMLERPGARRPGSGAPAALPVFERTYPALQSFFLRLVASRLGAVGDAWSPVGTLERAYMDVLARLSPEARPLDLSRDPTALPRRPALPVLDRLARLQAQTGIPIVVVRLEFDTSSPEPDTRAAFAARCRALSLRCHDTRDAFAGSDPRRFWVHPLDPHPDAAAHERFARSIADFLRDHDLLGTRPGAAG